MSGERVISFEVCANGDLKVKAPDGRRLVVDQSSPSEIRISGTQLIGQTADTTRSATFSVSANIGDVMEDGSIYAGSSPKNNLPMYIFAAEHLKKLRINPMKEYINSGRFHGCNDWQLASETEYNQLFRYREHGGLETVLGRSRSYRVLREEDGRYTTVSPLPWREQVLVYPPLHFIAVRYGAAKPVPR